MEVKKLKRMGILILILAFLLFIFTNTDTVGITVIYRDFDAPLIVVMLANVAFGFLLGLYVARSFVKKGNKTPAPKP